MKMRLRHCLLGLSARLMDSMLLQRERKAGCILHMFCFFSGISFSDLSYNRHSRNFHTPWLYTEKLLCQFPQSFENKCETIAINFSEISFTRSIRRDGCRPIIGKLTREADIRR